MRSLVAAFERIPSAHATLYRACVEAACQSLPKQTTLRWSDDPQEPELLRAIFEHRALPTTFGYATQRDGHELEHLNPLDVFRLAQEDVQLALQMLSDRAVGAANRQAAHKVLENFMVEHMGL